ncbi:hypothetical protein [Pseudophaeobacter sp.]|uniref:hypothetical protein n=1 Tax=Pseudophaeobacter sp. TaxID=1971739 RepID=UPI00329A2541
MAKRESCFAKRQLGIKISTAAYGVLERRAGDRNMSPTTLARWLLLDRLGYEGEVVFRGPRRKKVIKPFSAEYRAGISLLQELQLIRMRLDQISPPRKKRKQPPVIVGDPEEIATTLHDAQALFRRVLASMSKAEK